MGFLLLGCSSGSPALSSGQSSSQSSSQSSGQSSSQSSGQPTPTIADPNNPLFIAKNLTLPQQLPLTLAATIHNKTFKLAVAQTPEQQQMGLMYRTSLTDDEGMIFPFDPPRPVGFWMKNTLIELDMLYLNQGVIKEIKANTPPCKKDPCPSYPSKVEIDNVIEIRGGLAKELGFKVGDRVSFSPLKE